MRIGIIGINHKLAKLALRERLAKVCQRRFSSDRSAHGDRHAFVLLSTCNRTEIYFFSDELADTHSYLLSILRQDLEEEFDQKLYSYFGQDCFLHLARVVAGLDSAIVAETEIQGQVKTAYENAHAYCSLPFELHYLFQKCLKIGKQVRTALPLKSGLPDLEHAILNAGQQLFGDLQKTRILCIGASEINFKVISFLRSKGCAQMALCNRSAEHAVTFAANHGLSFLDWRALQRWEEYDWIIFGTKSPDYLLKKEHLADKNIGKKLIIDLCVPRNVDPNIYTHPQIQLLNIDQINHALRIRRESLLDTLNRAEQLVYEASKQTIALFHQREINRLKLWIQPQTVAVVGAGSE